MFAWHARAGAFERLTPPWESVRIIEREGGIEDGARAVLEMRVGPVPVRWTARHLDGVPGRQFVDEQEGGPFAEWRHTHRFLPSGDGDPAGSRTRSPTDRPSAPQARSPTS